MKNTTLVCSKALFFTGLLAALVFSACRKSNSGHPATPVDTDPGRKIRFELFTSKDFSGNSTLVDFLVFIKARGINLFDSTLSTFRVQDIPHEANKVVVEKTIRGYDTVDLAAGFFYEIHDVGFSWHIDTSKAGNRNKVVSYDFQ